jgi:hypothetical protein
MLTELYNLGWVRWVEEDGGVYFDGDEIYFTYNHPAYYRCDLTFCVRIGMYAANVRVSLFNDGDKVHTWDLVDADPEGITERCRELCGKEN